MRKAYFYTVYSLQLSSAPQFVEGALVCGESPSVPQFVEGALVFLSMMGSGTFCQALPLPHPIHTMNVIV